VYDTLTLRFFAGQEYQKMNGWDLVQLEVLTDGEKYFMFTFRMNKPNEQNGYTYKQHERTVKEISSIDANNYRNGLEFELYNRRKCSKNPHSNKIFL